MASPDGPRASRPKRWTFTREYKRRILGQYEAASTPQERNGLLRRKPGRPEEEPCRGREREQAAALDGASLLELQKLMYFLQEAGQPLRLKYVMARYGPYADNLNHVLQTMGPLHTRLWRPHTAGPGA